MRLNERTRMMSRGSQRGTDFGRSKRHRAHPHAGCLEHGAADRRKHDGTGCLPATPGRLVRPRSMRSMTTSGPRET